MGVVSVNSQFELLNKGWEKLGDKTIQETQIKFNCCAFSYEKYNELKNSSKCPFTANGPCFEAVKDSVARALKTTGIVALIFSFTNVSVLFYR